jgi:hypothetical protein
VAEVAVATSISPNELLAAPPTVFWAIVEVLREQTRQAEEQQRKAKGRR